MGFRQDLCARIDTIQNVLQPLSGLLIAGVFRLHVTLNVVVYGEAELALPSAERIPLHRQVDLEIL
jgi:hypothetical protein